MGLLLIVWKGFVDQKLLLYMDLEKLGKEIVDETFLAVKCLNYRKCISKLSLELKLTSKYGLLWL